jgi:hypothetical protein
MAIASVTPCASPTGPASGGVVEIGKFFVLITKPLPAIRHLGEWLKMSNESALPPHWRQEQSDQTHRSLLAAMAHHSSIASSIAMYRNETPCEPCFDPLKMDDRAATAIDSGDQIE